MKQQIKTLESLYLYGIEHMYNGCKDARMNIKDIRNQAEDKKVRLLV